MASKVLERWMPSTLAELRDALDEALAMAADNATGEAAVLEAADPDVVYTDLRDVSLVRNVLSDGSVTFDLLFRENK